MNILSTLGLQQETQHQLAWGLPTQLSHNGFPMGGFGSNISNELTFM
jgi:hypothetical protein